MGSSGSGNFSDYPGSSKKKSGSDDGGASVDDRCARAFSVTLADVEHCDYYKSHGAGPAAGTTLIIAHKKRVVAQTTTGEIVGTLPTTFNYLVGCIRDGFTYAGEVRAASVKSQITVVSADFVPAPPK